MIHGTYGLVQTKICDQTFRIPGTSRDTKEESALATDFFAIITRDLCRAMRKARVSATEHFVIDALVHQGVTPDGEVGVSACGYVMSSADVAEYVGDITAAAVRRAVSGLVRKGVLAVSRTVSRCGRRLTVYRVVASGSYREMSKTNGSVSDLPHGSVSDLIHTPIGRPNNKQIEVEAREEKRTDIRKKQPKFPYPESRDDVVRYAKSAGGDASKAASSHPDAVADFFDANSRNQWLDQRGNPIHDWHVLCGLWCASVLRNHAKTKRPRRPRKRVSRAEVSARAMKYAEPGYQPVVSEGASKYAEPTTRSTNHSKYADHPATSSNHAGSTCTHGGERYAARAAKYAESPSDALLCALR